MTESFEPPAEPQQEAPDVLQQSSPDVQDDGPVDSTQERPTDPTPAVRTGVPAVDQVLSDVERLEHTPLDQHVAVFEEAHQALRAALDADPGDPA